MKCLNLSLIALLSAVSSNVNAALVSRLGGQAIYDDVTNRTYIADANYASSILTDVMLQDIMVIATGYDNYNTYETVESDFDIDINGDYTGSMTAAAAWGFARLLTFGGVDGWEVTREDDMSSLFFQPGPTGFDYQFSTAPSLFTNIPDFSNLSLSFYHNGGDNIYDQLFSCNNSKGGTNPLAGGASICPYNGRDGDGVDAYAFISISGDVLPAVIPVPAAVWLFGSGLIGLAGIARRNKV
ncbi:MAG TPA: VPLPA-CTERM sorting domain-containing protein [Alphaproteobacteria bacterium]|jgi:hypothetical protein|nr:VPLPA-CTERM sorting domain-containing protein [Alphaproteobacteria bacterium]